jgi:hypothetical protein
VATDVHELGFDLSLRSLTQQESALNELRGRTGTLLAASSLVASFLGGRAVAAPGHGWLTVAGLAAFVASLVASGYVLWPKSDLVFALRGSALDRAESDDTGGLPETHRRLAAWIEQFIDSNAVVIDRLFWGYRVATVAVFGEVVLWMWKLGVS